MFLICNELIIELIRALVQCLAYGIQSSVSIRRQIVGFAEDIDIYFNMHPVVCLVVIGHFLECCVLYVDRIEYVYVFIIEQFEYLIRCKLLMALVRDAFHHIADFFPHFYWKHISEILFEDVCYTALSGLTVYAYDICFIFSSHIMRIDRKIRHAPSFQIVILSEVHSLCYGILMGSGECSKYQLATIRLARRYFEIREFFEHLHYVRHI